MVSRAEASPKLEHKGYNRGLILGLTMTESMLLLVFCLLLVAAAMITAERKQRMAAEQRLVQLETQNKELSAQLFKGNAQPHEWPPIINLSEAGGYYFTSSSAALTPEFEGKLETSIAEQIADNLERNKVDVVEVIGHTDEQRVARSTSNLDDASIGVIDGRLPVDALQPADNSGLGLARAIAVANVLKANANLKHVTVLPMSAAQLVVPGDKLTAGQAGDVLERRRIEIRIRRRAESNDKSNAQDLYAAALKSGVGQGVDPNGQASKEGFLYRDIKDLRYLNQVVPQLSSFELKRGSVIPVTLITGLSSDLPGRITAQVSQNVYYSATGHRLLVPQGAKLFGRYDSKVSFGQDRVLIVWTDLIFPDGSTLQISGMAGTDAEGYGGFRDKTDRHLWRAFGSAALVALIGTGIDMSMPESSTLATQDTASDAARRNFAESFGRVAEQTISRNLNAQPTITIRPGYKFNVLVDQDIVFPSPRRSTP